MAEMNFWANPVMKMIYFQSLQLRCVALWSVPGFEFFLIFRQFNHFMCETSTTLLATAYDVEPLKKIGNQSLIENRDVILTNGMRFTDCCSWNSFNRVVPIFGRPV